MSLRDKIKKEMIESIEDKIVRELKQESSFDEKFIRKRFRQLSHNHKVKENIFNKLNWEERKYFVDLCAERDKLTKKDLI